MTSDAIPPPPHPFSAQPGYDEDGQPDLGDTTTVATPAHPRPDDPEPHVQTIDTGTTPARIRVWAGSAIREALTLPEGFVEPANLMEIWDYANKAAFTTRADSGGMVRAASRTWALVTMPIAALALTALWALPRMGRCVAFVVTLLLVGTGVAQIPLLGWLVPDLFNVTAW